MKNLYAILIIAVFAISCGSSSNEPGSAGNTAEAMEMLEAVFEGPYSKWAIQEKLDTLLKMHDMELVKENYLKVGNALVALRKESNNSFLEVDIINSMIEAQGDVSFDQQLRLSVRSLEKNLANKE